MTDDTYHLITLNRPIAVQTAPRTITWTSTLVADWGHDYPVSGQEVEVYAVYGESTGQLRRLDKPATVLLKHGTIAATQPYREPPAADTSPTEIRT